MGGRANGREASTDVGGYAALALTGLLVNGASAGAGAYDDPFFLGWSTFLPAAGQTADPCVPGA